MDNEVEDLVDLDEDLMREISGIFSHHSSVEGWVAVAVDPEQEPMSERISRCGCGYHWRMRSDEGLGVSSSIVLQRVITVVAREGVLRLVRTVVGKVRSVSEYRQCSA